MPQRNRRLRSLSGTPERIVNVVRRAPKTAREIAAELGMTYHAVRQHVLTLERDRILRATGVRGTTRPATVYDIAPAAESALSSAYVPFVAHLTKVLAARLPERQLTNIMRDVGRRLAGSFPRPQGTLRERALAASAVLQELGAPNEVIGRGRTMTIRSAGCVLAEAVHGRPDVCHAMASFLGELLQADVRQRCDQAPRPRCCFEIQASV